MKLLAAFQATSLLRTLQSSTTELYNLPMDDVPAPPLDTATSLIPFDDGFPRLSSVLPPLPENSRRIYLLRHGETEWNAQGKIQGGGFDIPLNENGRLQAIAAAKALEDIPLTVIASSTLSRAKETADILWKEHDACHRVLDVDLKEMGFGEFEGLAIHSEDLDPEVKGHFKRIGREVKYNANIAFPGGGESTTQVEERARGALYKVLKDYPADEHVAIVSHGRTNKVLIASVAFDDVQKFPTIKQSNTAINCLDMDKNGKWSIQSLNYIEHVKHNVIVR
jgi:broad specificity phosphatase PhoE